MGLAGYNLWWSSCVWGGWIEGVAMRDLALCNPDRPMLVKDFAKIQGWGQTEWGTHRQYFATAGP